MLHADISQEVATSEVNVANSVAGLDQADDGAIGDARTVAQMDVMQVFPKLANRIDGTVRDESALCQHQVS